MLKKLFILPLAAAVALTVKASDDSPLRPVTSAYTFEVGGASLTDTYLSPATYRGIDLTLGYERLQAMRFSPERWVMQLQARISFDRGENRVGNATMLRINGYFDWGMMHRRSLSPTLTLALGGAVSLDAGTLYNARNSNNPASVEGALTANLTGYASWRGKIGSLPVVVRYQPSIPIIGIFFAPDYDELYYEIYLGNRHNLVHPAWIGNRAAMTNTLTADFRFGATALRLGYRGTMLSASANHLTRNIFTHAFIIGISGEWLSIDPRRPLSSSTRIISAIY